MLKRKTFTTEIKFELSIHDVKLDVISLKLKKFLTAEHTKF